MTDLPTLNKPLKQKSQTYTKRRSINFTNVKIAPKKDAASDKGAGSPGADDKGKPWNTSCADQYR